MCIKPGGKGRAGTLDRYVIWPPVTLLTGVQECPDTITSNILVCTQMMQMLIQIRLAVPDLYSTVHSFFKASALLYHTYNTIQYILNFLQIRPPRRQSSRYFHRILFACSPVPACIISSQQSLATIVSPQMATRLHSISSLHTTSNGLQPVPCTARVVIISPSALYLAPVSLSLS